jgi:hypothetical protein
LSPHNRQQHLSLVHRLEVLRIVTMAERILMNEFKALLKEKWVHVQVSSLFYYYRPEISTLADYSRTLHSCTMTASLTGMSP